MGVLNAKIGNKYSFPRKGEPSKVLENAFIKDQNKIQ